MIQELLGHTNLIALPLLALVLFILVFFGVVVRTYGRAATEYEPFERLPLGTEDEDE